MFAKHQHNNFITLSEVYTIIYYTLLIKGPPPFFPQKGETSSYNNSIIKKDISSLFLQYCSWFKHIAPLLAFKQNSKILYIIRDKDKHTRTVMANNHLIINLQQHGFSQTQKVGKVLSIPQLQFWKS